MNFFLQGGGSCSYDDETVGDIDMPLRYKHLVKQWVPKDLRQVNTDFCVNERIYRIAPSLFAWIGVVLHGRHKGWIRQMYIIDGVCWTLLQL